MCETESKHVENDSYVRFDGPSTQNHMLVWKTCPKTVLVLKKRGKALLPHLRDVARHLWFELNLQVVVEPEVGREISGMSDLDFVETYDNEEDAGKLHEFVDFVVCLGGDGVVLHASNLFPGAMPPVISFNLGSLGFLTNHWHEEYHKDLIQLNANQSKLVSSYNHLVELSHVLQKCDDIFSEARSSDMAVVPRSLSSADLSSQGSENTELQLAPLPPVGGDLERGGGGAARSGSRSGVAETRLGYVTGVLDRKRLQVFERVLFRATRGNVYMRSAPIMQQVRDLVRVRVRVRVS